MQITIPEKVIPGQIITIKSQVITVQPEPLEVNGQTIPQTAQTITIPEQVVTTSDYKIPSYVITVADPIPAPTPIPVPAPTPSGQMFDPNSFINKPLPANAKLRSDSASLVSYLVAASKDAAAGGASKYYPSININDYSVPIFEVTDASLPKQKITVQTKSSGQVVSFTELHKQLQSDGFRLPANLAGSDGTDGSCVVYDKTEDSMLEAWQYRLESGVHKISWGAVIKNVSKHPGFIATLPNGEKQGSRASGIALASCIARFSDVKKGKLPYAIGVALPNCALNSWVAPAQRTDGYEPKPSVVKMGTCFRLPSNYVVPTSVAPIIKMYLEAIRDYGMYVVDTTAGNNVGFQVEDIGHLAPAGTADRNAWAWEQYKPFWGGRQSWDIMRLTSLGGQMPWDKMVAVEFPIQSV